MKRKNPTGQGRGFAAWARKMRSALAAYLQFRAFAVKLCLLNAAITWTSTWGMRLSLWTDSLQVRIDALGGAE